MLYILLCLSVAWFLFMTYLSHQDGVHTGQTSRRLAKMLWGKSFPEEINQLNGWLRRAAHTGVYFILTVLGLSTVVVGGGGRKELLIAVIALILWSVIDEATKVLIPGRHFSWFDVGLNMVGVLIGAVLDDLLLDGGNIGIRDTMDVYWQE